MAISGDHGDARGIAAQSMCVDRDPWMGQEWGLISTCCVMKIEVCPVDGASSCDATAESVRCGVIAGLLYRRPQVLGLLLIPYCMYIYIYIYRSRGRLTGLFVAEIRYIYLQLGLKLGI